MDAREFTLRQQLDEKMVETLQLRARVEELTRSQDPVEQLKRKQKLEAAERARTSTSMSQQSSIPAEPVASVNGSADERIQNLLKSMEDKLKQPQDAPLAQSAQPAENAPGQRIKPPAVVPVPVVATPLTVPVASVPVATVPAVPVAAVSTTAVSTQAIPAPITSAPAASAAPALTTPALTTPASIPAASASAAPTSPVKDEWQEFAASLATLTRGRK